MKLVYAQFCPLCGCRTLERDWYRLDHTNSRGKRGIKSVKDGFHGKAPEFTCDACGAAFMLAPSLRHNHATSIIGEERRKGVYEKEQTMKQKHGPLPAEAGATKETRESEAR